VRADLDLSLAAAEYIGHTTDGKGMNDIEVIE
jgi:rare lipoprotein A (peptidoglycan hydrolase)